MSKNKILDDLDKLIKRASAEKQASLKQADGISAKLDNADDGTSPASTGAQAAANMSASKEQYADPSNDVGAEDNRPGESVSASTDKATAVSTDGQEGTKGGELAKGGIGEADNGSEDTDSPENNGFNSGSLKSAAEVARNAAKELRKQASAMLSPFDQFLVKAARASTDPELKKTAQEMDDMALADASAQGLEEQLASGSIGDEEATAILEEAIQSGALTEEEVMAAMQATQGGAGPEAGGMPPDMAGGMPPDMAGGMPPEMAGGMPPEMAGGMPPDMAGGAAPDMGGEPAPEMAGGAPPDMLEAKLAAADIGPDHPEYLKKIASFYPSEIQQGYAFAMKLAEEMSGGEEGGEDEEKGESAAEEKKEDPAGIDEEAAAEGEPVEQEAAEQIAMGAPAPVVGPTVGPAGEVAPGGGDQAALAAIAQELGIPPEALMELLSSKLQPEAAAPLGKIASALKAAGVSAADSLRTLTFQKVAALRKQL